MVDDNKIMTLAEKLAKIPKPKRRSIQEISDSQGVPIIFTDNVDMVVCAERLYGEYNIAEDFLEAFDNLVTVNQNAHAVLQTVINKPCDLTRKDLLELQEWFDRQHFDESTLRVAWKETKNQDVAARLIGHIRRAAMGDALMPFEERVDHAISRIKGENTWTDEQNTWLDRLSDSLKEKVVIDDDTFKSGNFKRRGGKRKLTNVFDGELDTILAKLNDYVWDQPA